MNHFINATSYNETIQDVFVTVKQWSVSTSTSTYTVVWATTYIQLATPLSIIYLSLGMHSNIYRKRHSFETNNYNKVKEVHFYQMKMYISVEDSGILCWIIFTRCMYQFAQPFHNFLNVKIPRNWAKKPNSQFLQKLTIYYKTIKFDTADGKIVS